MKNDDRLYLRQRADLVDELRLKGIDDERATPSST